jgi:hypothetical protein
VRLQDQAVLLQRSQIVADGRGRYGQPGVLEDGARADRLTGLDVFLDQSPQHF